MCIWLPAKRTAWAMFSYLKKQGLDLTFLLHIKMGHEMEGGKILPSAAPPVPGITCNSCAHTNAVAWAWAWPTADCSLHTRVLCGQKTFHDWGQRCALCLSGLEAVWRTGLGFNSHLAKPCLSSIWVFILCRSSFHYRCFLEIECCFLGSDTVSLES